MRLGCPHWAHAQCCANPAARSAGFGHRIPVLRVLGLPAGGSADSGNL